MSEKKIPSLKKSVSEINVTKNKENVEKKEEKSFLARFSTGLRRTASTGEVKGQKEEIKPRKSSSLDSSLDLRNSTDKGKKPSLSQSVIERIPVLNRKTRSKNSKDKVENDKEKNDAEIKKITILGDDLLLEEMVPEICLYFFHLSISAISNYHSCPDKISIRVSIIIV